jgi:hypothetical protein
VCGRSLPANGAAGLDLAVGRLRLHFNLDRRGYLLNEKRRGPSHQLRQKA